MTRRDRTVDVLVVGAGPAGLAAGGALAAVGAGHVEILEREAEAGGVPRQCHHGGFGARPSSRGTDGPDYARRSVTAAVRAGAVLRTGVGVTGWAPGGSAATEDAGTRAAGRPPLVLDVTGPDGLERITARAVVLATGARERPRSARLVPGTRPAGVYTTGELQQSVHLHHQHIGTRAVVIGDDPVGDAARDTLRAAGVTVVARVTDRDRAPRDVLRAFHDRTPLLTGTTVTGLTGRGRLTGVAVRHRDGRTAVLPCDTVVFTGDYLPVRELARSAGASLDPGTRGPAYDAEFRTTRPGLFAVGNLLHGIERAGFAAAEGRAAAGPVLRALRHGDAVPDTGTIALEVDAPLLWVAPNLTGPADKAPLGGRFVLRTAIRLPRPVLAVTQDGRELTRRRLLRPAEVGRPFTLDAGWTRRVDPLGAPVRITAL